MGGAALFHALQRLKEKMKVIAASLLEASASDVTMEDGKFFVTGSPQKSVSFDQIALTANNSNLLAKGLKPQMARLTLARKIAAITLSVWKKGERFNPDKLMKQAN